MLLFSFWTVTGEILRCIVIVEAISRFEIETTTRLLYLEDSPEELIIKGYDDEGMVLLFKIQLWWMCSTFSYGTMDRSLVNIIKGFRGFLVQPLIFFVGEYFQYYVTDYVFVHFLLSYYIWSLIGIKLHCGFCTYSDIPDILLVQI